MAFAPSDLAVKYEDWSKATKGQLEQFVVENGQWHNIWFAWNMANSIDVVGLIAVDLLRFGEGLAEGWETGSAWPVIADVGRGASIAGPLAKGLGLGASTAVRAVQLGRGRLFFKTAGSVAGAGPCVPTTMDRALILAGQGGKGRLFVKFADYVKALGKTDTSFAAARGPGGAGIWAKDLLPYLKGLGKKVAPLFGIDSPAKLAAFLQRSDDIVTFSVKWVRPDGVTKGHQVLAYRDAFGRVVWNDGYGKIYPSLEALAAGFGRTGVSMIASDTPLVVRYLAPVTEQGFQIAHGIFAYGLAHIAGVRIIETMEGPTLAIEMGVPPQVSPKSVTGGTLKGALAASVQRAAGRPVMRMPPIEMVGKPEDAPPRPDWLTGVQWRLNAIGLGAGPVDGIMGPKTRHAVRAFQREQTDGGKRLAADGIPGPRTQARLVEVVGY